jgi:hypothetical protein
MDPESFSTLEFHEVSNRVLFKKINGSFDWYEPETYTLDEFKSDLEELGEVTRFETYTSSKSLLQVTRGSVIFDNIERFFHIEYSPDALYKSMVDGVISCIKYTKEVSNGI